MDVYLTTREKISLQSTPLTYEKPSAMNLALNLVSSIISMPYFSLNNHLHPTILTLDGLGTNTQVPFFISE